VEPLFTTHRAFIVADSATGAVVQRAAGYGGISLVQMKGSDSDWMGMNNKYGQAWEVPVTPKLPWCDTSLSCLPLYLFGLTLYPCNDQACYSPCPKAWFSKLPRCSELCRVTHDGPMQHST